MEAADGTPDEDDGMTMREALVVDRSDFTAVAREQLPWLYSLARRLVGDAAEDVVQECLIKAYRSFPRLRDVQAAPRVVSPDPAELRPGPLPA